MRSLTKLPDSEFFKLLKTLSKTSFIPCKDISSTLESLVEVMKSPYLYELEGEKLATECLGISRLVDLVGVIPISERAAGFIETKMRQIIAKMITPPITEFNEFSVQLIDIVHEKDTFECKRQKFQTLRYDIERLIEDKIEILITNITEMYKTVDDFVTPQLYAARQSILDDMRVFINNPGDLSTSPLETKIEIRGGIKQFCLTRKYSNALEEFRKYIEACIGKTVDASNPSYDVVVNSVISEDEVLYLSTFLVKKK